MACRVLPGLTLAAAVRANAGGTNARWLPPGWPAPRTLLPISQRSRLAADIAADAGALLPHPFTPYQQRLAGLLSVAVLRHRQFAPPAPPLTVSRGGLPHSFMWARSREVPLKGSGAFQRRRGCVRAGDADILLLPCCYHQNVSYHFANRCAKRFANVPWQPCACGAAPLSEGPSHV